MNMKTEEILLRTSLQDCREKHDKLSGKYLELQAENAKLREELATATNKLEMAEAVIAGNGALITGLKNELAAAQAMIGQMRGAIGAWERADGNEELQEAEAKLIAAMNAPTNLDALHEDRARECERLAEQYRYEKDGVIAMWLREEAAAHRARKEGK